MKWYLAFLIIWAVSFVAVYFLAIPKYGDFELELVTGLITSLILSVFVYWGYKSINIEKKKKPN